MKLQNKLTENFTTGEFIVSADHPELLTFNLSSTEELKAFYLCSMILQPTRDDYGRIKILSGKRSDELNDAVEGSIKSDHLFRYFSCAVDFTLPDAPPKRLFNAWRWIKYRLCWSYGQLIYYPDNHFIHVSLPTPKHKYKALIKQSDGSYKRVE